MEMATASFQNYFHIFKDALSLLGDIAGDEFIRHRIERHLAGSEQ